MTDQPQPIDAAHARHSGRRLAFQLELADRLRPLSSAAEVLATASGMLGEELGVARVICAEIADRQHSLLLRHEWAQPGVAPIRRDALPLGDFGPEVVAMMRAGQPVIVQDVEDDPRTLPCAAKYVALQVRAAVSVPLLKPDGLALMLTVHSAQPRTWSELEVQLVQDVAERIWLAVQAAGIESQLRQTQTWLAAVFDSLPVGVGVFAADGSVQLANRAMQRYMPNNLLPSRDPERQHRWRATDAQGRPVPPRHFPGARALRGERVVPGIEALYSPDRGEDVWTEVAAVPIRDREGRITGQVSVVHEIDTLKRAEAAQRQLALDLAEANERQNQFLAVLAHELRNPLAPILTALELMRMRPGDPDVSARVRDIVDRQARQLVHLIDDLLDVARVSSGKITIRREPVDLHAAVATAVETSLPLIEKAAHELEVKVEEGSLPLLADATRLAQIVSNLLTNAAKYTPRGGRIHLAVQRDGGEAVVSVRDNGIGIAPASLGSLFRMFSQLQAGGGAAPGGLGIGLALVKQLVALHGGSVSAASEGPGRGSTFTVRLPLSGEHLPPQPPAQDGLGGRVLRILVADDNVDAAQTLAALLAAHGHETQVAHDGPEALRGAARKTPDIVFLDIGMPGMTGYDVARRMRAEPSLDGVKLVALTGWGTEEDRARARDAGFDAHFTKPVSAQVLGAFLEQAAAP